MNSTLVGNEDGLVGYWNFDDGAAKDLTANGNDGELNRDTEIVEMPLVIIENKVANLSNASIKAVGVIPLYIKWIFREYPVQQENDQMSITVFDLKTLFRSFIISSP